MANQFEPNQILIHGPNVKFLTKSAGGLELVMWPGEAAIVIVRGRAPFFRSVSYPTYDKFTDTTITGSRFMWNAVFKFRGGMAGAVVKAARTTDDLEEIGAVVKPLLNYMVGRFTIG